MAYYTEQLKLLQEQVTQKKRVEARLEKLQKQRVTLENKVDLFKAAMQAEQSEVERLEGRSLTVLFARLSGKYSEKLDAKRKEAYAAAVKYDTAMCELAATEEDLQNLEKERKALSGCDKRYAQLLQEKTDAVKASASPEAAEILRLEQQITALECQKKEINEAISAGKIAKSLADAILSKLGNAEDLGMWDLVTRSSLITDLAKHGTLDEAQELVEKLQVQLRRFQTELTDVTVHAEMQVNIDGLLRFSDFFFDDLISSMFTLNKIKDSQNQVLTTRNQIESALRNLDASLSAVQKEQAKAKTSIDEKIRAADL